MRWFITRLYDVYNDAETMFKIELLSGVCVISIGVLVKAFGDQDLFRLVYLAVKHLLYFSPLVGSDTVKALIAYTPLWDLRCHNNDHSCVSYDLDKTFYFGDNSYRNSNCFRSCYWQVLVQTLRANDEVVVSGRNFEFVPWKLCWSYKSGEWYHRGLKLV